MIQRGKKGSERGSARQDLPQTLNEGEKDGWLLREMGQMAGTRNLLTLGDSKLFFWEVAGLSRQTHSGQAQMTTSPFPPAPSVRTDHVGAEKVTEAAGAKAHLCFCSSPALPPPSLHPPLIQRPPAPSHGQIPAGPRTVAGQSGLPRKGGWQDAGSGAAVCEISWLLDMLSPRSVYTSP